MASFALDRYEVTVGRFRKFVGAYVSNTASAPVDGAGANPAVPGTGWQSAWNTYLPATRAAFTDTSHLKCDSGQDFTDWTWTDLAGTAAEESRAINCVSWHEAFAFCIWDGGRLGTESEWEYAAVGGSENRLYPWGNPSPDCTYANAYGGRAACGPDGSVAVAAVGSYPEGNSKWGHADLAGNVFEWVFDWYGFYSASTSSNYANMTQSGSRISRGGAFINADRLRAAERNYEAPDAHHSHVGVRCARTVQ